MFEKRVKGPHRRDIKAAIALAKCARPEVTEKKYGQWPENNIIPVKFSANFHHLVAFVPRVTSPFDDGGDNIFKIVMDKRMVERSYLTRDFDIRMDFHILITGYISSE